MGHIKQLFKYAGRLNTRGFWAGFITGSVYFSWTFRWFLYLHPLNSLGIESNNVSIFLISFVFVSSVVITAFWWGIASWLGFKLIKKGPNPLTPLILAGIFTLAEYVRAVFFSIFWYGNGGAIGPYWPIGNPAYLFADFKFIALSASWWGIYGIDFGIIFLISLLFFIAVNKEHRNIYISELGILIAVFTVLKFSSDYFLNKSEKLSPVPVAIVQTDSPSTGLTPEESLADFQKKLDLIDRAAKEIKEGLIIFPEGTDFFSTLSRLINEADIKKYFDSLSPKELLVINGIRAEENDAFKSRVIVISSKNGLVGFYDKQILTMGGEFLPNIIKFPSLLINPGSYEKFKDFREYIPGKNKNLIKYGDKNFNIVVCSELKSPLKSGDNNPDFITVLTSFSMWKGNLIVADQDRAITRFRAIENGKYVVLASNAGQSYIINPSGNIEKITSPNSYELLTGTIIPNRGRTWYNYVGDWPILLLSSVFFAVGLKKIRNDRKS